MAIDTSYENYARLMAASGMTPSGENYRQWVRYCESLESLAARVAERKMDQTIIDNEVA